MSVPQSLNTIREKLDCLLEKDPLLRRYEQTIFRRLQRIDDTEASLTGGKMSLADFASGHEYFGLHFRKNEWVFREWAPHATAIFLIGEMNDWREAPAFAMNRINSEGEWEIRLPKDALKHGDLYRLRVHWSGGCGDRIPAYARRVVQDGVTLIFNAQVWHPQKPYGWKVSDFTPPSEAKLIYEVHVGMAQEEKKIGTYGEFTQKTLPRVVEAGYNTLQLMAIQEHPYYASFGYHVSSFFAASSRFGTPEDLKTLIDTAHSQGLQIIIDLVHSHAVSNEVEGLSRFDGTLFQFFHEGERGIHRAWDSRCFDYGKHQVLHFLLSNCRFWLDEYRVDGFRFDGITSMLYLHHGFGKAFTSYDDYFDANVDEDALVYLAVANKVIHEVKPQAITIAEDVSGMPGLALSTEEGGIGFDYRFAMGIPDYWIKLTKDTRDEDWPMGQLWYELNNRREGEKTISYAESHDQALVGDQTLIFRLMGPAIYDHMGVADENLHVERGMALIKMIRLITLATAGAGYFNFMGNEFGHPEWIDFPREGNNWTFHYARRQWHLADDSSLKYSRLNIFDRNMITLTTKYRLLEGQVINLKHEHNEDKVIAFERANLFFAFNYHPTHSHVDYHIEAEPGKYRMIFNTDSVSYGGYNRLKPNQIHFTLNDTTGGIHRDYLSLYLPSRTAVVLEWVHK